MRADLDDLLESIREIYSETGDSREYMEALAVIAAGLEGLANNERREEQYERHLNDFMTITDGEGTVESKIATLLQQIEDRRKSHDTDQERTGEGQR